MSSLPLSLEWQETKFFRKDDMKRNAYDPIKASASPMVCKPYPVDLCCITDGGVQDLMRKRSAMVCKLICIVTRLHSRKTKMKGARNKGADEELSGWRTRKTDILWNAQFEAVQKPRRRRISAAQRRRGVTSLTRNKESQKALREGRRSGRRPVYRAENIKKKKTVTAGGRYHRTQF